MAERAEQLALSLDFEPLLGRDDIIESAANAAALRLIDEPDSWTFPACVIVAPPGAGKTHLATIWAASAGAETTDAAALDDAFAQSVLTGRAALVEDVPAQDRASDAILFQLLNSAAHDRMQLLMTSQSPPETWPASTEDLRSRLSALPFVRIEEPDDALLTAVMMKQLADRQIVVAANAIGYAAARIERTYAAARDFVGEAERLCRSHKKQLTLPLARQALAVLSQTS